MNDRDRLEQLREMLDRLERMPASGDRDWMLSEVRARTVDVETGVLPAAMRPRHQEEEEPSEPAPRVERRSAPRPRPRPAPRPTWHVSAVPAPERPQPVRHDGEVDLLQGDGLLCLDEPAVADRPWTRGLRG